MIPVGKEGGATVDALRGELTKLGLPTDGKKEVLVTRLKEARARAAEGVDSRATPQPVDAQIFMRDQGSAAEIAAKAAAVSSRLAAKDKEQPQEAIATPTPPGAVPAVAAQVGGRRKKHKKSKKYYKKTQAKKRKKTKKR